MNTQHTPICPTTLNANIECLADVYLGTCTHNDLLEIATDPDSSIEQGKAAELAMFWVKQGIRDV